jgi:hypothetical protein
MPELSVASPSESQAGILRGRRPTGFRTDEVLVDLDNTPGQSLYHSWAIPSADMKIKESDTKSIDRRSFAIARARQEKLLNFEKASQFTVRVTLPITSCTFKRAT